ncbi:MAG: NADH-quinone oxidoreductase subunit C [Bacillota bacterium]
MSEFGAQWISIRQGECVLERDIPRVDRQDLAEHLAGARNRGGRLAQMFGRRQPDNSVRLYALVALDVDGQLEMCAVDLPKKDLTYPAVTPVWPAAQAFEREIAEQYGVNPLGHPWLKALRYHGTDNGTAQPWGPFDANLPIPGHYPFYRVEGEEVHEVAVGPVHAGIIEPGHFRFQCHGEEVLHLEIVLGYQHRGAEPLLQHPNATRCAKVAETIAGDTSIGHGTAYCVAIEGLAGVNIGSRAAAIRGIALELERLANHVGDLGAMGMDIGFLPTASYLGRLRGEYLNLTLEICGNRFGRDLVRPGGVVYDIEPERAERMRKKLVGLQRETLEVLELLFSQASVLARFEGTGALKKEQAMQIGLVGPVARACGYDRDVRRDHPFGVYQFAHIPVAIEKTGDVYARAVVRWLEVQRSLEFLLDILQRLPEGKISTPVQSLKPGSVAVGLAEAWRGEVAHVAFTDDAGRLSFVKVKDPSIHNWFGLAQALRGQAISDFPLCNKSFNLSYAGHDL